MMFLPFQVLGAWLRGLLSLLLLGLGISLLGLWYTYRDAGQSERVVVTTPEPEPTRPGTREETSRVGEPAPVAERVTRHDTGQFGFNRETAYLLGGAALLLFSLGGGGVGVRLLFLRRGGDEPEPLRGGAVRRLRRPDGTELHVECFGPEDGPVVLLTHGWSLDRNEWCYVRRKLAASHRVIVWDLPGLGRSGRPANNDWSLEKMAADLEAVLSLAGDRPAVLVGHSIGGMILLTFCRLFPEALGPRVRGLVLVHSTYTNPVRTTARAGLYTALQKPVLEPLCHLMVWLSPLVWLMNLLSFLNGSAHRSTERASFSGRESRGQLNFLTRYYLIAWPGVVARGMLAMFRYDATATLARVPVPTLVVAGDRDELCTPEASAFMASTLPRARQVTHRPARHCGQFEYHEEFGAALEGFLAETLGTPAGQHAASR